MLYLIGLGLKPKHLTLEALECIKNCDSVFLEDYTSEYSEGNLQELKEITGKEIHVFGRKEVEENFESALLSANKNNIGLLIFGNPLTATTHLQILIDAKEKWIKTKVIPGISITNTLAETGLDEYKFGRIVTICFHAEKFAPDSFYKQILENVKIGLHTLCLLDIKKEEKPKKLMNCIEAIEILKSIAKRKKSKAIFEYVAMLGMGSEKQKIIFGEKKISAFKEINDIYPQSLIVLGKTNEKEKEALEKLHE